jgi:hypothetical protein
MVIKKRNINMPYYMQIAIKLPTKSDISPFLQKIKSLENLLFTKLFS